VIRLDLPQEYWVIFPSQESLFESHLKSPFAKSDNIFTDLKHWDMGILEGPYSAYYLILNMITIIICCAGLELRAFTLSHSTSPINNK
jgi:hypothetical protein